jgi:hypothetical protein
MLQFHSAQPSPGKKIKMSSFLHQLRQVMSANKMNCFIIPSEDAHQGESVGERDRGREWISGFSGER